MEREYEWTVSRDVRAEHPQAAVRCFISDMLGMDDLELPEGGVWYKVSLTVAVTAESMEKAEGYFRDDYIDQELIGNYYFDVRRLGGGRKQRILGSAAGWQPVEED